MVFSDEIHLLKSRSYALQGLVFALALSFAALIGFHIAGMHVSLMFVPLIAIYLWPRRSDQSVSLMGLFVIGIWIDLLLGGAIGCFAIINILCFYIFRPDLRSRLPAIWTACFEFGVWMIVPLMVFVTQDLLLDTYRINIMEIAKSILAAFLIFPVMYQLRKIARQIFFQDEEQSL